MRRVAALVAALALVVGACAGRDRYETKFVAGHEIAKAQLVAAVAVGPNGVLYYGERKTGDVYSVDPLRHAPPTLVTHVDVMAGGQRGLLSVAEQSGSLFLSYTRPVDGRLEVLRAAPGEPGRVVWTGPPTKEIANGGHITFDTKGRLLIGLGEYTAHGDGKILELAPDGPATQKPVEISRGWHNPFGFVVDVGNRLWVADNSPGDDKELVARGRERNVAKRRRLASALPPHSTPSGLAVVKNELYVCSYLQASVYRLHIGLDAVARRRGVVKGLRCRTAIVTLADGSIVTATDSALFLYRARP